MILKSSLIVSVPDHCLSFYFEKFRPISLPSHLSGLKESPIHSFLRETGAYKTVSVDDNQNNSNWTFVAIIIVASDHAVIVIVWLIAWKHNCYLT